MSLSRHQRHHYEYYYNDDPYAEETEYGEDGWEEGETYEDLAPSDDSLFHRFLHGGVTRLEDGLVAGFFGNTRHASALIEYRRLDLEEGNSYDEEEDVDADEEEYDDHDYEGEDDDDEKMIVVKVMLDTISDDKPCIQASFSDSFRRRHGGPGVAKVCIVYPRYPMIPQAVLVHTKGGKHRTGGKSKTIETFFGEMSLQFGNDKGYYKGIHRLYKKGETKELRLWVWDTEGQNSE